MTEIDGQSILWLRDHPWAALLQRHWRVDVKGSCEGKFEANSISIVGICIHPAFEDLTACAQHPRPPLSADDSVTAEVKAIALGSLLVAQFEGASAFAEPEEPAEGLVVISYSISDMQAKPKPRHPKKTTDQAPTMPLLR